MHELRNSYSTRWGLQIHQTASREGGRLYEAEHKHIHARQSVHHKLVYPRAAEQSVAAYDEYATGDRTTSAPAKRHVRRDRDRAGECPIRARDDARARRRAREEKWDTPRGRATHGIGSTLERVPNTRRVGTAGRRTMRGTLDATERRGVVDKRPDRRTNSQTGAQTSAGPKDSGCGRDMCAVLSGRSTMLDNAPTLCARSKHGYR
ncbi:hypothetical protein C8J57DRAFT_1240010 [Mycena rebaudengoi]|nr:hypothetical protein C8J57DRAFT_1240010 [Mycena rebaudengoi]